jgi:hypothetical protein
MSSISAVDQTPFVPEVRTRRLVVADDDDRPRIVAEVVHGVAELKVFGEDPEMHVLVYAGPVAAEGTAGLGLELFVRGDSVARVHAWADGRDWHWTVAIQE